MTTTNWRRTTNCRISGFALLCAIFAGLNLLFHSVVRADVVGIGDIFPFTMNEDEDPLDPDDNLIPDLPQFGNAFEDPPLDPIPLIIVGGTGSNIGGTAAGQLTIDIPSDTAPLESVDAVIGGNIFGLGLARVVSLNSEWRVTNQMTVGQEGVGFLEIVAGARVTTDLDEQGTQNPNDEADQYDFVLSEFEGAQGFALIDGFASLLLNTNISVGHRGQGRIDLLNRARLVTRSVASIGTEVDAADNAVGTGYVMVDGQGTRWTVGIVASSQSPTPADQYDGELYVGRQGRGTLEILNQGWVSVETDVYLGFESAARGEIIVSGQNSQLWALEEMFIGNTAGTAEGELTIADKAIARADVGTTVGALGYVELQGGTLLTPVATNNGVMRGYGRIAANVVNNGDIRNAAALANQRERLIFSGTVENTSGSIIESIGGEMEFESLVTNNGQIFAKDAILRFRGGLAGGGDLYTEESVIETPLGLPLTAAMSVGPGVSNVIGDVNLTGMSVTLGDDFSQLFVTGDATLGGALSISFDSGYTPTAGDSFEILSAAGGYTGSFSFVTSPAGHTFSVDYTDPESVFVTYAGIAPPGMGADFNGDGIVDGADLAIWSQNFGLGANPPPVATQAEGDANGDGVVDGADFLLIQQKFGGPPAVPAAGAVPEPSSLLLVAATLVPLGAVRRRKPAV